MPDELKLLHCEDFRDDSQYTFHIENLVRQLFEPEPQLGKLFAVPSLPPHYLVRSDRLKSLKDTVLTDLQKPAAITGAMGAVGIQGMGGIGKSVLAAALAREREVRRAFPDGVVWVTFGQEPNLAHLQRAVVRALGSAEQCDNEDQGRAVLRELLAQKAVFVILDDLRDARHALAFDVLGRRCRVLVTTRDGGILHALNAVLHQVTLFSEAEALHLLADSVDIPLRDLPPEAALIVEECGRLPLAVALCGGMAQRGMAWANILQSLREADLEPIEDRRSIPDQSRSIWRAMQVSIEMLTADKQRRFAELAIFPADSTLPETSVIGLWCRSGQLNEASAREILVELSNRSLLRLYHPADEVDASRWHVSLHDLIHDFVTHLAQDIPGGLVPLHAHMARFYSAKGLPTLQGNIAALKYLPYHACEAHESDIWLRTMTDFGFIHAVLERVDVTEVFDSEGTRKRVHAGYYVIKNEIDHWLAGHLAVAGSKELILPLRQVWHLRETDFVISEDSVMPVLYRDLTSAEPKRVFDLRSNTIISKDHGPISDWCERERNKYETPASPWVAIAPPEPSTSDTGYLFVSYKREDLARIVPFMHRIVSWGFPIWYDRGIPGCAEWDALIESKVAKCGILLVFLSEAAVGSKWVRREIKFADSENRPILGIRLDKHVELKHGLKVVMNQYQMIDASSVDFSDELRKAIEYGRLL